MFKTIEQHESPDSTYKSSEPFIMDRAQGSLIRNPEGQEFIDLCAGFGSLPLGHSHESLRSTFSRWSQDFPPVVHGMGDVYCSRSKILLIQELLEAMPPHLSHVSLSVTGSGAVETALKTAILHTGSHGFISLKGGYHGLDMGTLPVTDWPKFKNPFNLTGPIEASHVPIGASKESLHQVIQELERGPGFAGIIMEPIQGRAGMNVVPQDWLTEVRNICQEAGGLVILDEIFCGLGRAGLASFSTITPADIIVLGKALGGGFPISACLATAEVMNSWPKNSGEAIHTGTFFGHPLSCLIGYETLKVIRSENLITRSRDLGQESKAYLQAGLGTHTKVDIKGQGLFMNLDFKTPGMGPQIMKALLKKGVMALASGAYGEGLSITPALNIPKDLLFNSLDKVLSTVQEC